MNNVKLGSLSSRQIVAAEETHSFAPTFVNAVRFGFNHEAVNNNQSLGAINPVASDGTLASFADRNAAQVLISGVSPLPGGVGGLPTYLYHWNSLQFYDDAFLNRGKTGGNSKDRKSTRNSSHSQISYAVFCLKKKKKRITRCARPGYRARGSGGCARCTTLYETPWPSRHRHLWVGDAHLHTPHSRSQFGKPRRQ